MENKTFRAFFVEETENGMTRKIVERKIEDLPAGEVLIKVEYSSLNYKDALSSIGNKGVTRKYPHTPGIDAAGVVVSSEDENIKEGMEVIVTGYDLGMNTSGGYGEYIRVPAKWVVPLPAGLTLKESMMYGTAGLTAAISVYKLVVKGGIKPEDGEILVTGATGGVGSIAVKILNKLGYKVVAATGKIDNIEFLLDLGATRVIDRKETNDTTRPMLKGIWAGVIDTVGGNILSTAIKSTKYNGVVTACGNALSGEFTSSVYPFILRGVTLYGVDSVEITHKERVDLWNRIANEWKVEGLEKICTEVTLEGLEERIQAILGGKHLGRTLVKL